MSEEHAGAGAPSSDPALTPQLSDNRIAEARTRVRRVVEVTTDKLRRNRSIGGKTELSQSQPALPAQVGHAGVSLRRKEKERSNGNHGGDGEPRTIQSQLLPSLSASQRSGAASKRSSRHAILSRRKQDDSPFITPRSPSLGPRNPDSPTFRGVGSIRAGTQALIQALQAMPWAQDQDEDDLAAQDNPVVETSSDDDDGPEGSSRLASSIHAIYRPLARSKRALAASLYHRAKSPGLPQVPDQDESPRLEASVLSDGELEDDFEPTSHASLDSQGTEPEDERPMSSHSDLQHDLSISSDGSRRRVVSRSGSMSTVKIQRRARLAEKLRDVFQLSNIQEVIAEMPCWLLRSIMLQGYLYLTDSHLCFFAHMPSGEDQILKSGYLSKKTRTKRWVRRWFILKNDVLSWYLSPADPYFPHGIVDLRYAMSCELVNERDIRIRTNQKSVRISADSGPSRDEWVKAIKRVMFKAQNMGDSVKIAIPYSTILDVTESSAMDFSETLEIKVIDRGDPVSVDSYFFAYFSDLPAALEQIRNAVLSYRGIPEEVATSPVIDNTSLRPAHPANHPIARTQSTPADNQVTRSSGFSLTSIFRPFQESLPLVRSPIATQHVANEEFTHVTRRGSSPIVADAALPESSMNPEGISTEKTPERSITTHTRSRSSSGHTYPPSTTPSPSGSQLTVSPTREGSLSPWAVPVPSWLRMPSMPSRQTLSNALSGIRYGVGSGNMAADNEEVSEVVSPNTGSEQRSSSSSDANDFGFYSILQTPASTVDAETLQKFRDAFAFDEKEILLGVFPGYLYRLLPVYGRLYVSTNHFCFKSSGSLNMRTKMILPLRDILSTEKSKAFRFGHHGLVVMVRGHEELFFEFGEEDRRTAFASLLEQRLEEKRRSAGDGSRNIDQDRLDALILEESGPRKSLDVNALKKDRCPDATMGSSLPAFMFNSTSSTFLTFKPEQSLRFTFLTIGSRGDVQPYIALAKGLMKDGHRCRIATHGEFKDWIEGQGIQFEAVGGDPAELMRLCVENGTFTVAFLREGLLKFRGWLDDLLKTSWDACQDTDVLIESPSAIGGYHIAEALRIPYFRAFTMTWSRTRAYPHAFAVPEHKMGGNYNYMSYVLFDQVFWRAIAGQVNRWRRNTLGLPGTSLDKMEPHKIPFLYNFSPVMVPRPLDWPEWIHVTGYWFLDDADVSSKKWTPPQDLMEFLGAARKAKKRIVYIGFGSIVVPDPQSMTRCVIDAVLRSGVYAILSKGWSDRLKDSADVPDADEPLPKQIYHITSIPHDWLFQRIDAACHHGGAGTTGASLRAGIPTIIRPFFGDQFFWADRVEALGVGTGLRKLTVETLTHALITATTDQKQIARAKAVGEKIHAEDGVSVAIEAIYRDLEYARSFMKKGFTADDSHDGEPDEHATIRERLSPPSSARPRARSSSSVHSAQGASSDWSVISGSERE